MSAHGWRALCLHCMATNKGGPMVTFSAVWQQSLGAHGQELDGADLAVFCSDDDALPVHAQSFRRPLSRITPDQRASIEARAIAAARRILAQCAG